MIWAYASNYKRGVSDAFAEKATCPVTDIVVLDSLIFSDRHAEVLDFPPRFDHRVIDFPYSIHTVFSHADPGGSHASGLVFFVHE